MRQTFDRAAHALPRGKARQKNRKKVAGHELRYAFLFDATSELGILWNVIRKVRSDAFRHIITESSSFYRLSEEMDEFGALVANHYNVDTHLHEELVIKYVDDEFLLYIGGEDAEPARLDPIIANVLQSGYLFEILGKESRTLVEVINEEKTKMETVVINIEANL